MALYTKNSNYSFPPVFLATATVFLLLLPATAAAADGDLCEATDYKPLCKATLKGITDPIEAVEKTIQYALLTTKKALSMAKAIGDSDTNEICIESYDDAVSDLEESEKALKDRNKGTINTHLSAAISYFTTCDDAFAEMGELTKLTKANVMLEHIVSNCLALVTLMK